MLAAMPRPLHPQRHRAGAAALVLAAHLLALMLLARLAAWGDREPHVAAQPPLVVQLLRLAPPQRAMEAVPARVAPTRRPEVTKPLPKPVPASVPVPAPAPTAPPQAISPPAGPAPAATAAIPPAPAAPASATAPPPLNLALPRRAAAPWRQRLPALDDPRSNTARATFEDQLREAMGGDGRWALERIDEDHIHYRNGSTCVDIRRSRAEQLDGFNRGFSPKPWLAGDRPYRC
jgi:hypothetical protein